MNKGVIIGIVIAGIAIGIIAALSVGSLSMFEGEENPISENEPDMKESESKPQGRDLSIEFDEKMGLSAP